MFAWIRWAAGQNAPSESTPVNDRRWLAESDGVDPMTQTGVTTTRRLMTVGQRQGLYGLLEVAADLDSAELVVLAMHVRSYLDGKGPLWHVHPTVKSVAGRGARDRRAQVTEVVALFVAAGAATVALTASALRLAPVAALFRRIVQHARRAALAAGE